MCTGFSILRALLLGSAVTLFAAPPNSAKLSSQQTRPRTLTDSTEQLAEESNLPAGSSEAKAEAKKVYKAGVEYGNAGLFSQAAELFQRAIKLRPDYADAYRSLGHAYFDLKEWDKSVQSLERALELNPKDKDSRKQLDLSRSMLERDRNEPTKAADSSNASHVSTTSATTTEAANESSLTKLYRVGPGDVLNVHFGDGAATESATLTVTPGGLLEHPKLSESLKVAGLTVEDIAASFESALKQRTPTNNAKVSIEVQDYVSHVIMVSGLVKEPGAKILRREAIPLSVVVADAQPLPEAERAIVVRNETGQTFTVDLASADMNLFVHPADVITLQPNATQFFYVSGEVKAPGEKVFRRGLTLTQAIITAGGAIGVPKEVRVGRDDGKGFLVVTRYPLKDIEMGKVQDPLIQPGDRITVIN
jgi:protein involved in polysaccharide export with SLBB domain